MPDRPKLTPARRHALTVLLDAEKAGVDVRVSNHTGTPTLRYSRHTVYWQSADWLDAHGLTTRRRQLGSDVLTLTATGRQLAEEAAG